MILPLTSYESDIAHELEFMRGLKRRDLEQKFIYLNDNALSYYRTRNIDISRDAQAEEYYELVKDKIPTDKHVLFISIGCGNSEREIGLINTLIQHGRKIQYLAADSSKKMLELSYLNLQKTNISYQLIHADITSNVFSTEIMRVMKEHDFTVISLLGRTMGNMVQTEIADSLYNLSQKGNLILLDLVTRSGDDQLDKVRLFKKYAQRLEDMEKMSFYFHPLQSIGIPYENGQMEVHASTEDSIGVQKFQFVFRFKEPTEIRLKGQTVHFLPPESIRLLDIRCYYIPTLITFFDQHKMSLVNQFHKSGIGVFLFERR